MPRAVCVGVCVCHTFACSCCFVWNASMQVEVGSIRSSVGVLLHVSSLPSVATTNKHGSWWSSAASRVGFRFAFALLLLPVIAFFVHVAARSPDGGRPTHVAIRKECKQSDAFPRTRSVQCRVCACMCDDMKCMHRSRNIAVSEPFVSHRDACMLLSAC